MHLIHKLKIGEDCPAHINISRTKKEEFIERLKSVTTRRLELRPQDTQEVIFID